jgi:RHS repeat-associated protein
VIVGSRKLQYDYNALGQLVRKRVNGTPVAHFLWDQDHLLAELNGTDTLRVAEYAYYPGVDQPLAIITGATSTMKTSYLQQDPLGNVIGALSNGPTVDGARYPFDPWGFRDVAMSNGVATSDTTRLRFQGLVYEGDSTQLYYVRNRWYDPRTHRFLTQDPTGLEGGFNPYAFAGNDPVNYRDPKGLEQCIVIKGAEWWELIDGRLVIFAEQDELRCTGSGGGSAGSGPPPTIGPVGWRSPKGGPPRARTDEDRTARARACFAKRLEVLAGLAGDAAFLTGAGAATKWVIAGAQYARAARLIANTSRLARTNRLYYATQASQAAYQVAGESATATAGAYFGWGELQYTVAQTPDVSWRDFVPVISTIEDFKEMLDLCD